MLFDAPRNELFDFSPRFAASAAPAAICCFLDFAGMPVTTDQRDEMVWSFRAESGPRKGASTHDADA